MRKSCLKNKSIHKAHQSAKKVPVSKKYNTALPNISPSPSSFVSLNPKTTNTYDRPPSPSQVDHDKIKDKTPSSTSQKPTYNKKIRVHRILLSPKNFPPLHFIYVKICMAALYKPTFLTM